MVRDDGSSDDTLVILQQFSNKINKVSILSDRQNLGASFFSKLVNVGVIKKMGCWKPWQTSIL